MGKVRQFIERFRLAWHPVTDGERTEDDGPANDEVRKTSWSLGLEQTVQDLRHGWRMLRKNPGFASIAILSLALGIGVNTAIFSLLYGIVLQDLPLKDADRVVQLQARSEPATPFTITSFNYSEFQELRQQRSIFDDAVGVSELPAVLDVGSNSQNINLEYVTGNFFSFFAARPEVGRLLNQEDDHVVGAHPVCILSDEAWRIHFARDPRIIGKFVRVNTVPLQVVGITVPNFVGATLQRRCDMLAPTAMLRVLQNEERDNTFNAGLHVLAKLRSGVSLAESKARLIAASPGIEASLPTQRPFTHLKYDLADGSKGLDDWRTELRKPLLILMSTVGLVLLIACANLTNLFLNRASERQQEFAIKLSLGMDQWRLSRQLLIESLLLTLGGGLVGNLAAWLLLRVLVSFFNAGGNNSLDVSMNRAVLWFTLGVSMATALIVGTYPAWFASRTKSAAILKGGSRHLTPPSNVRRILIAVQVSLSVILMLGAALFARSLGNLELVDLGYDIDHVVALSLVPRHVQSTPQHGPPMVQLSSDFQEFLGRAKQLPGIKAAALSFPGVLQGLGMQGTVTTHDDAERISKGVNCSFLIVSPHYFSTLGIPILRGRDFTDSDRTGSPIVALLNRRAAELLTPAGKAVGKYLDLNMAKGVEVVGVVGNSKYQNIRESTTPIVYMSAYQMPVMAVTVFLRIPTQMARAEKEARALLSSTAPSFQMSNATTMELIRDGLLARDRLLALLSSLFGALGTIMALVGIYGLIACSVTSRTREIGVRMSMGAQQSSVLNLFIGEALKLLIIGIVIGLASGLLLGRFVASLLFGVLPTDPRLAAIALGLVLIGGLLAALVPAVRAIRMNPADALRYE